MAVALALMVLSHNSRMRRATSWRDLWDASRVLQSAFPESNACGHFAALTVPGLTHANVFFTPDGRPIVGIAEDSDLGVVGVVQVIPGKPSRVTPAGMEGPMGFVQNLATEDAVRRQGCGESLMRWAEREAQLLGIRRLCLAVDATNVPARMLHAKLNFTNVISEPVFGNFLLAKDVDPSVPPKENDEGCGQGDEGEHGLVGEGQVDDSDGGGEDEEKHRHASHSHAGPGFSPLALVRELSVQGMYASIAIVGISLLVAPFGGLSASDVVTAPAPAWDLALGISTAAAVLYVRRDEWLEGTGPSGSTSMAASTARQWAPGERILQGESKGGIIIAVMVLWQFGIAVSEELYFRGLLQNGLRFIGHSVAGSEPLAEAVVTIASLAMPSLLFGAIHTEWVDGEDLESARARKIWFRESAATSLLFGSLCAVTEGRVLAPIMCHGLMNSFGTCSTALRVQRVPRVDRRDMG